MSTPFAPERFVALARTQGTPLGEPLTFRPMTDSTNDDALDAARSGAPAGSLFVAGEQRRGRGRRGSEWHSTPDASLAFSVLLRPKVTPERAGGLSLVAGLAVRHAIAALLAREGIAAAASVKWPNDVWIGDKKVAGILTESQVQAGNLAAVVVGIGLNVGRVTLPSDVERRATSLAEAGVGDTDREALLVRILKELWTRLLHLERALEVPTERATLPESLVSEFSRYDALRGLHISVDGVSGAAAGIDAAGNLLVETERGARYAVAAGHVEIL